MKSGIPLFKKVFRKLHSLSFTWWLVLVLMALNAMGLTFMVTTLMPPIYETHRTEMDAIKPDLGTLTPFWQMVSGIEHSMLPDGWFWNYPPETVVEYHRALGDDTQSYWLIRLWDTFIQPWLNFIAMGSLIFLLLRVVWGWTLAKPGHKAHIGGYIVLGLFIMGTIGDVVEFVFDILTHFTLSKTAAAVFFWGNTLKSIGLSVLFMVFVGISLLAWPVLCLKRHFSAKS
ncbi:MAG: hypothetical protein JSV88_24515 [Candidatus Aminicenantes bacterium]|nr:MAG: hypothetical protein JSV88_24515 [Candidatus Aminicenantes bacterium]